MGRSRGKIRCCRHADRERWVEVCGEGGRVSSSIFFPFCPSCFFCSYFSFLYPSLPGNWAPPIRTDQNLPNTTARGLTSPHTITPEQNRIKPDTTTMATRPFKKVHPSPLSTSPPLFQSLTSTGNYRRRRPLRPPPLHPAHQTRHPHHHPRSLLGSRLTAPRRPLRHPRHSRIHPRRHHRPHPRTRADSQYHGLARSGLP